MTVKEVAKAPRNLYFVISPEGVESVNLWKTPRLSVFFPAVVQENAAWIEELFPKRRP